MLTSDLFRKVDILYDISDIVLAASKTLFRENTDACTNGIV